jgi:hypothetical protein
VWRDTSEDRLEARGQECVRKNIQLERGPRDHGRNFNPPLHESHYRLWAERQDPTMSHICWVAQLSPPGPENPLWNI